MLASEHIDFAELALARGKVISHCQLLRECYYCSRLWLASAKMSDTRHCYMDTIFCHIKCSSCAVYDQNFCLETADSGANKWCFMSQPKLAWYRSCHSLDYNTNTCQLKLPQPQTFKACPTTGPPCRAVHRKYRRRLPLWNQVQACSCMWCVW